MVCCRLFFLHITVKWSYSSNFVSCSIVLFLYLHKQPFITAQSQVITAHIVYHCTVF